MQKDADERGRTQIKNSAQSVDGSSAFMYHAGGATVPMNRHQSMTRYLLLVLIVAGILAGCGGASTNATPTPFPPPTDAHTATVAPTDAPTTTPVPSPAAVAALPTATPPPASPTSAPLPSPTPTSGPLNDPVPALPKGGASCQDYPCPDDAAGWEARIQVPPGFHVRHFAVVAGNPNSITFGPDDLLYIATMQGAIWTLDPQGEATLFQDGFVVPVGLAFQPGTDRLYVSSRAGGSEAQISVIAEGATQQVLGGIPCCYAGLHAANGLAFGPDGYGYVAVGARADHGEVLDTDQQDTLHPWEASVLRFSPDGQEVEVYAQGLRNAYDIAWDASGRLFAADNAPDFGPPDEFHLVLPGKMYGYPWYECDTCFPAPADVTIEPPLYELLPHVAPTGITAYTAEQFPGYYNNIFLALWSAFEGAQKIVRFGPGGEGMTDFATGFAEPADVTVGPDGSLYVADWATGVVFRIFYGE